MMSIQPSTLLFFVLAFMGTAVLAVTIEFDPNQEEHCLAPTGCSFDNSTIWVGGIVPSLNDTAEIKGAGNSTSTLLIYIPTGVVTSVISLLVHNASFEVQFNSSLIASAQVSIGENSALTIKDQAGLWSYNSSSPRNNATFTLAASANLHVEDTGTFWWNSDLLLYGNVVTSLANHIYWYNTFFAPVASSIQGLLTGNLFTVPSTSVLFPVGLTVSLLTASGNSSITFGGNFTGQIAVLDDAYVEFNNVLWAHVVSNNDNPAVYGTGLLNISNSVVTFTNKKTSTFNGTINIVGASTVTFYWLVVPLLQTEDGVTIFADGFVLSGTTEVRGTLIATGATGVSITGFVNVIGSLFVNNSTLSISESATLVLPSSASLALSSSSVLLGGLVIGDVSLPFGSSLTVTGANGTVLGNVVNGGLVTAAVDKFLNVFGNFSQTLAGTLVAGINSNSDPVLVVTNGTLSLDGKLQYTIKDKPFLKNSVNFLVAESNWNVTGTFNGTTATALKGSSIDRELDVQYNGLKVYVKYNFHPSDVEIWMWVVVGVVVALVLVGTVAVVVKCRKRVQYDPVR